MLETTQGIVLHYNRYNDDSAIVDIFTLSRGSVSFLVRDRRQQRKKSIHTTLLRPLNVVEVMFDYRATASLQRIQEVHIAHCYTSLPYDPIKETVALFLSEFLHNVLFHVAFLTRMTYYLGFWPNMDKKNKLPFFDLKDSIATDTEPKHNFFLKGQEVAMMPKLLRMNVRNMHRFLLTRQQRNRMLDVLTLYYQLHVPEFRDLRSLAVLREVLA